MVTRCLAVPSSMQPNLAHAHTIVEGLDHRSSAGLSPPHLSQWALPVPLTASQFPTLPRHVPEGQRSSSRLARSGRYPARALRVIGALQAYQFSSRAKAFLRCWTETEHRATPLEPYPRLPPQTLPSSSDSLATAYQVSLEMHIDSFMRVHSMSVFLAFSFLPGACLARAPNVRRNSSTTS